MNRSESIKELAAALAKAQGDMKGAVKDSANPFFKSKYADLSSCWDACRGALSANGICVVQTPTMDEHGVAVETLLAHSSGEWITETLHMPVAKADAQGVGSAITYARRYMLTSFVGIAPEDDDGNAAALSSHDLRGKGLKILKTAAVKGLSSLEQAWKTISADMRAACKNDLAALKTEAAAVNGEETHAPATV